MSAKFNGLFEKLKIRHRDNEVVSSVELAQPSVSSSIIDQKLDGFQSIKNYERPRHQLDSDRPCLAQTLQEVIQDSTALSYLINFLEEIGHLNLLKFWLHVDGLKACCLDDNTKQTNGVSTNSLNNNSDCKPSVSKAQALRSDANNIFSTYIDVKAPQSIELPVNLKCNVEKSLLLLKSCETSENIFEHLNEAQEYVWQLLANRYFKEFLRSHFYAKYNIEVMLSGKISLEDILRSHKFLCSFIEFLENEGQRQLLEFVIAVDSFVSELDQMDIKNEHAVKQLDCPVNDVQEDAMLIYDRYFSMQATDPLGFGTKFVSRLKIAADLLQNKYIPLFVESHHFSKIVEGLKSTIENMPDRFNYVQRSSTSHQHRPSNASLPSGSISEHNTPKSRVRTRSYDYEEDGLEDIDMPQCSNAPQTLGKGGQKRLNSLAKVDRLGRYKPLFDNSLCSLDDSNSSIHLAKGRLKNTLDKYLNQTAAKESLAAEEVAELIIEDIQKKTATINAARREAQLHRKRP
uniref:RGS domain-containing protein n=1 Tax=Ditylenchus dipsaci TaxID=166011 RepID=A0A915DWT6_9BILA